LKTMGISGFDGNMPAHGLHESVHTFVICAFVLTGEELYACRLWSN
jgi:hypothetical protein